LADRLDLDFPIVQAPMAGAHDAALAIAVTTAGGLGSLPCAMLSPEAIRDETRRIRAATNRAFALNFFCHEEPKRDPARDEAWRRALSRYYQEFGLADDISSGPSRSPFGEDQCKLVEELAPPVVSFHFGLPRNDLLARVRDTGAVVMSSATTVAEAKWLEQQGVDFIIAQGLEAGGHRGMFLSADPADQVSTLALVPQIVDAVSIPVIAAGGIADARGIAAAFCLGADAVQIGTAYLHCEEARISDLHRIALRQAPAEHRVLTNVITGRPARGIRNRLIDEQGPLSAVAPQFPRAADRVVPLRAIAEKAGKPDFSSLWSGQAGAIAIGGAAGALTALLADETAALLARLAR
jgi:nitronate monooxygenase